MEKPDELAKRRTRGTRGTRSGTVNTVTGEAASDARSDRRSIALKASP